VRRSGRRPRSRRQAGARPEGDGAAGPAVVLVNEQDRVAVDRRRLRRLVRSALRGEDVGDARSVTVVIGGDARLSDLCARFLGRPRRTDVLAFPGDGDELGDVVVNADRARREARRRGIEPEAELLLYVVHGLLHLVGYDDQEPADRRRMRAQEAAVLGRFGYRSIFDATVERKRSAISGQRSAASSQRSGSEAEC